MLESIADEVMKGSTKSLIVFVTGSLFLILGQTIDQPLLRVSMSGGLGENQTGQSTKSAYVHGREKASKPLGVVGKIVVEDEMPSGRQNRLGRKGSHDGRENGEKKKKREVILKGKVAHNLCTTEFR